MSWKQRILAQHHDLGQLLNYPLVLSNIAMDNDSFLDLSPSPFPGVRSYGKNSGKFHSHPAIPWFHLFFSRGFIVFFPCLFAYYWFMDGCLFFLPWCLSISPWFHLFFPGFFPLFFSLTVWRQATCWAGFWSSKDASLAPRKMVTSRVVSSGPASAMIPGSMMNNDKK